MKYTSVTLYVLILCSGIAALSWEAIWQLKSSLALGVSAWGTALTISVTMGGMCIGALLMGRALKDIKVSRPLRIYAVIELLVGLAGLNVGFLFGFVENIDTWVYAYSPRFATLAHITGIALSLGVPTLCLGASLPVIGLLSKQFRTSLAYLYAVNTLGAASGVMIVAFVLIPLLGVSGSVQCVAALNIMVALIAWFYPSPAQELGSEADQSAAINSTNMLSFRMSVFVVMLTGFITFVLEVAWFRALTAAFMSTSEAFAVMLSSTLLALGIGAWLVPIFKRIFSSIGTVLLISGILILIATPIVERVDLFVDTKSDMPLWLFVQWYALCTYVIGLPVLFIGVALPWILESQHRPKEWSRLYALNAFAGVVGAICSAWIFLPLLGFAKTAWLAGGLIGVAGVVIIPCSKSLFLKLALPCAFAFALCLESGAGHMRVLGESKYGFGEATVLASYEGPDVTTSVVQYKDKSKILIVDGFVATAQAGEYVGQHFEHYMQWMGHLPMAMHDAPKQALVICMGTGQTANAVRLENPDNLDVVDINKNIFKMAHHFESNNAVLQDPRVRSIVMDGRAYMRRTRKIYDVITLEPMPPNFAGVNALYSKEFYVMAKQKLSAQGYIAQWLPFHLVSVEYGASIARTFQDVFPDAVLWIDPQSTTGILLGSADGGLDLDAKLSGGIPGYGRGDIQRTLTEEQLANAFLLNAQELAQYASEGKVITDDNQMLSYGVGPRMFRKTIDRNQQNYDLLEQVKQTSNRTGSGL